MLQKCFRLFGPLGAAVLVILSLLPAPGGAQPSAASAGPVIQPTLRLKIPPPVVRTWREMEAAEAAEAAAPPGPPRAIPFRPTMDAALYRQLKANAAKAPAFGAPQAALAPLLASAAATTLTILSNFSGVSQISFYPPDTEGAVGPRHFVEITNPHLDIYQKSDSNHVKGVSLASFFGYATKGLFDPRVLYDSVAGRWIVTADAFAENSNTQKFFIAVSQGPPNDPTDPTGAFYIYSVNVSDNNNVTNGVEWDFPQVGLDQNAVIFTANFYNAVSPYNLIDARMFTLAKSLLYNGTGGALTANMFVGLGGGGTLSAPIVLDTNPNTYLVAPATGIGVNSVLLYTLTNSGGTPPTLAGPVTISNVPTYSFPANAPQPGQGTTHLLDTADARFVNAGTQIGNSLFQVHSISRSANTQTGAICRFYEFDTVNKNVKQYGDFYNTGTSFDFNASLAANRHQDVFVTWSSIDAANGTYAQVRFSGRLHTDPAGLIPSPGSLLSQSSVALTGNTVNPPDSVNTQRWGDYSAVSLDPADPSGATAWIVNETVSSATAWGSRIGSIRLPVKVPLPYVDLLLLSD